MKSKRPITQVAGFMLAVLLMTVAGVRSWSGKSEVFHKTTPGCIAFPNGGSTGLPIRGRIEAGSLPRHPVNKPATPRKVLARPTDEGRNHLSRTSEITSAAINRPADAVVTQPFSYCPLPWLYFPAHPMGWRSIAGKLFARVLLSRPPFVTSSFQRVFGGYIVTNAP